jgi:adenylate kinase
MRAVILLGAPGAGKGTAAEQVKLAASLVHVSTGDMLRDAVKNATPVGREADAYMKRGELVPDDVIVRIVEDRLDAGEADAAYLFDGFPRTERQAELLEKSLDERDGSIDLVFFLDAPREVLISRLAGRRVCRACGATYHVVNIPPRSEGVCDACGGELYQRADDREETVANRLDVYGRQTQGLISRYEEKGLLRRVDSSQGVDELVAEMVAALEAGRANT